MQTMIDQNKMRALAKELRREYVFRLGLVAPEYRDKVSRTSADAADAIDLLLAEVEAAKEQSRKWQALTESSQQVAEMAQRRADKLRAELEAATADKRDGHRYRELLGLLLAGDIPMPESSVSLNVCGVPPNQDEFDEAVDFLLAQRQGE